MKSSGRCAVGELLDSCGDPAPDGRPVVILAGREFVDAFGALLERLLAVALEHQGGGTPDVDLGYHVRNIAESGIKIAEKSLD